MAAGPVTGRSSGATRRPGLGVEDYVGGFMGLNVTDPTDDTKSYGLVVRPLLPDETE